jgi:TolA-binding protein
MAATRPECAPERRLHRILSVVALSALICFAIRVRAEDAPPSTQPAHEAADAATKQLMAAHGLFQRGLFRLAAQSYADFLSENPQHQQRTAAMYALAICEYRQAEYDKASPLLNAVLRDKAFAQRDEVLLVLGHCEWARKRYEQSLAAYDELLAKHGTSQHAELGTLNRAQVLYAAGKYAEAAESGRKFLKDYPQSDQRPTALYVVGLSARAAKDPKGAADALNQLMRDYPQFKQRFDAMLLLGELAEAAGKPDEAVEQYRRALAIAPAERQDAARVALGGALHAAGQDAQAIAELSDVAAKDGPLADATRVTLGFAELGTGKAAEARQTLSAVTRDDPRHATEAKYGLGQCDMAEKKYAQAIATFDELLKLQPPPANAVQIAMDRAACLLESGKLQEAATAYETVAKENASAPQAVEANYRQAFCLHKLAKYEQSAAICKELLADKTPAELTDAIAELRAENLFLAAKYVEAAAAFSALADRNSTTPQAKLQRRLRIGQCAYFGNDYAKAVEVLTPLSADQHVAATPSLRIAIFLLGDALFQQGKFEQAIEPLLRFVSVSQGEAGDIREAQFKLATAQLRAKHEGAADQALRQLIDGPDDSPWVQRGLLEYAQRCNKANRADEAAQALNRLLSAHAPEECAAPAMYLLAWIDFDAKRYKEAAAKWMKLEVDYPKHALAAEAAFHRGVALKHAEDWEAAAGVLRRFVNEHPQSPHVNEAKLMEADCLTSAGKKGDAAAILASLAIDPKAPDAVLYDLAWSQRSLNKTADAQQTYRRLIKEHGDGKLATASRVELAEVLYADQKFAEAAELLETAAGDKSAEAKTHSAGAYRLAWCYLKLNKLEKAATAFAKISDDGGTDKDIGASATLQAGLTYAQQSRWESSEKYLAALVQKFPEDPQAPIATLKLGEVQAERSEYEASAQTYEQFLRKHEKNPQAYRAQFGIGWALENQKKYDDARRAYQKVISGHNGETAARAQFQIGETYLAEGKFDQAIPALLAVDDVYAYPSWSARALLESGRAFEQLKQADHAREQYKLVVSKYADSSEAVVAKDRLGALKGS